jgi:hypothetical protein
MNEGSNLILIGTNNNFQVQSSTPRVSDLNILYVGLHLLIESLILHLRKSIRILI